MEQVNYTIGYNSKPLLKRMCKDQNDTANRKENGLFNRSMSSLRNSGAVGNPLTLWLRKWTARFLSGFERRSVLHTFVSAVRWNEFPRALGKENITVIIDYGLPLTVWLNFSGLASIAMNLFSCSFESIGKSGISSPIPLSSGGRTHDCILRTETWMPARGSSILLSLSSKLFIALTTETKKREIKT